MYSVVDWGTNLGPDPSGPCGKTRELRSTPTWRPQVASQTEQDDNSAEQALKEASEEYKGYRELAETLSSLKRERSVRQHDLRSLDHPMGVSVNSGTDDALME